MGEDQPRQIASGIRKFVDHAGMVNRRCLVVCNLKPRKLGGWKSHGMVLCASSRDAEGNQTHVEFVTPPPNAKLGTRIRVGGCDQDFPAATPNAVAKKKIWEKEVMNCIATDKERVCCFNGVPWTVDGEVCTVATLAEQKIS